MPRRCCCIIPLRGGAVLLSIIIAVRLEKNKRISIGDNVLLMLGSTFDTGCFSTTSCSHVHAYESYVYPIHASNFPKTHMPMYIVAMVMHLDVVHPVLPWVAVIIYSKYRGMDGIYMALSYGFLLTWMNNSCYRGDWYLWYPCICHGKN